ncbi:Hypothetical predicted protein [Pelobates cultripes]|uniref:Uncharacterized protein n=1 Tax=Pelobates cultripes TaxID=61616 RepID=A0AAD1TD38_PELCU|nr:Hypothetical predicted protein [Pelobates cultripes]
MSKVQPAFPFITAPQFILAVLRDSLGAKRSRECRRTCSDLSLHSHNLLDVTGFAGFGVCDRGIWFLLPAETERENGQNKKGQNKKEQNKKGQNKKGQNKERQNKERQNKK